MNLELWSNEVDGFGYIVDEIDIKKRVFLENHTLIAGKDVSDISELNDLYIKESLKKKQTFDTMEFLFEIGRGWFNSIPYYNKYIEVDDYITFNHDNCKFESLIDSYSKYAERFIETYNEEGKPIILGEFEFNINKKIDIEENSKKIILKNSNEETYTYNLIDCNNYLIIKSDLLSGVEKGMMLSEYELKDYIENLDEFNFVNIY